MTPEYRKLPGKRRGFYNVSSVWAGPDHLLLVRGSRFREEYKRFYFRDVQAIAVARAPRFHISTRSFVVALCMLAIPGALFASAFLTALTGSPSYRLGALGLAALALVGVWAYISAAQSCRCRIYTAVSSDDLPSVYRLWTARKFLAEVEPLIAQTQGTIQGEWAAAAEGRAIGPAPAPSAFPPTPALPRRTLASDLFLVSLLLDGITKLAPLPAPFVDRLPLAMQLLTVLSAVAVLVQHYRGRMRAGMHSVAVAALIAFGTVYYVQGIGAGISASMTAAKTGRQTTVLAIQRWPVAQQIGAGIDAILLIVGLIVSLRED
jgi:hypothetical protein